MTLYFLPWLRRGLGGSVATAAVDGAPVADAATVQARIRVGDGTRMVGKPIVQDVALRGPGDVVGLDPGQVLATDPPPDTRDAEPNYFVAVELASADLPWLFTPAAPDPEGRLVPWLALVVVRDDGTNRIAGSAGAPLPVLSVGDAPAELPDLGESWAWAHVQSTADLAGSDLGTAYDRPEQFRARLLCPRRLDPDSRYIAALVPTFEQGRRAGLGLPPVAPDTTTPGWWRAWTAGTTAIDLPVYHSWTFRTGPSGDFETLVRRLRPGEVNAGLRDFDVGDAGTGRLPPRPPAQRLVSWLGALVSAAAEPRPVDPAYLAAFGHAMWSLINEGLAAGREPDPGGAYDPLVDDPVVGPPAYGALAIGADTVPEPAPPGRPHDPVWFGQANLDPVHRSVAGLGAEVVRRGQEFFMAAAWRQAAGLTEINRLLNWTRLAAEVGQRQAAAQLVPLSDAALLLVTAPAAARLRVDPDRTVAGLLTGTSLPAGLTSLAFQRICRPGGPVDRARRAVPTAASNPATVLTAASLTDLASALAHTALVRPGGLQIAAETLMVGIPGSGDAPATTRARIGATPATGTVPLTRSRGPLAGVAVAAMPATFSAAVPWVTPPARVVSRPVTVVGQDDVSGSAAGARAAVRPAATLSAKLADRVTAPGDPFRGDAVPGRLYASPEFTDPLYDRLRAIDPEFLLPGIGAVPANTVALMSVNSAFVEAFLLGANGELDSEFAWREYPATPGATWLRTFWNSLPRDGDPTATVPDIPPIARWRSVLGANQIGAGIAGTLALVVRGDLLRKYPDTVIYATKAVWNRVGDAREEDVTADGSPAQRKDPLFLGTLDLTTVFLGFDLEQGEALGSAADAGWFFAFEQPPAGPRFGLDTGHPGQAGGDVDRTPAFWRDASWYHLVDDADELPTLTHALATGRLAGSARRPYDRPGRGANTFRERWGADAAAMARITLQRPVRMLLHASAMLPEPEGAGG